MKATYNIKIDGRWYAPGEDLPEENAKAPAGETEPAEAFVTGTVVAETVLGTVATETTETAETAEKPKPAKTRSRSRKKDT